MGKSLTVKMNEYPVHILHTLTVCENRRKFRLYGWGFGSLVSRNYPQGGGLQALFCPVGGGKGVLLTTCPRGGGNLSWRSRRI